MKQLKSNIYKSICSILSSEKATFKTAQNVILFSRVVNEYPSKNPYCLTIKRILSFFERNVISIPLIIDTMKDEGEDEEVIQNIEYLKDHPTITTQAEVTQLCMLLSDYVKYSKILKVKNSFVGTLDVIDDDETPIKETVDALYRMSNEIVNAYNVVNVSAVSHTFDTNDREAMRTVVAETKDAQSPDKIIRTSIRGLNNLLSPGYLSGCLYVYAGLPGNYKSGMLLQSHVDTCRYNEHLKNATNGKTPISIYISMENSMAQTLKRLWSLLYPTADMAMFSVDEITDMIENALTETGFRSVLLYYGYREKSTADLANIIRSYNTDTTEVVAVYFDYIKRIRPARTDLAAVSTEKGELNAIMNELKLMAIQFNIPIVTGHQLNRAAAQAVDNAIAHGGYDKTSEVLGRSQVGSAFEVLEVADFLGIINIENNGENKVLMIKSGKQRDKSSASDNEITAIRHPFYSIDSFALKPDIMENVSLSIPIYYGKQMKNFMANI
jgi:replicative DNA helicase